MKCPFCGSQDDRVLETRIQKAGECIRRRRECLGCHNRFSTQELLTLELPSVVKKDGRREPFHKQKIQHGIQAACQKRSVPKSRIDAVVDTVAKWALLLGQREIPAAAIGTRVLEELKTIDHVAYVRFASVHQTFSDLDEFVQKLGQEEQNPQAGT